MTSDVHIAQMTFRLDTAKNGTSGTWRSVLGREIEWNTHLRYVPHSCFGEERFARRHPDGHDWRTCAPGSYCRATIVLDVAKVIDDRHCCVHDGVVERDRYSDCFSCDGTSIDQRWSVLHRLLKREMNLAVLLSGERRWFTSVRLDSNTEHIVGECREL